MKQLKLFSAITIIALFFIAAGTATAQTPTPPPTPTLPPSGNALDAVGMPTPFAIPTPDPAAPTIDLTPFWDRTNLSSMVSAAMTIFVFVQGFTVLQVIMIVAAFAIAWQWILSVVRKRQDNV